MYKRQTPRNIVTNINLPPIASTANGRMFHHRGPLLLDKPETNLVMPYHSRFPDPGLSEHLKLAFPQQIKNPNSDDIYRPGSANNIRPK